MLSNIYMKMKRERKKKRRVLASVYAPNFCNEVSKSARDCSRKLYRKVPTLDGSANLAISKL